MDGVATDPPPPPPSAFSPPGARAGPVGGTVVNTASRVESVCHGGQVAVSGEVHDALGGVFPDQAAARCPLGEGGGVSVVDDGLNRNVVPPALSPQGNFKMTATSPVLASCVFF